MILVLGSLVLREGHLPEALALSKDHVQRSRKEPGCVSHDVHLDAENPQRLVFVERWTDHPALLRHFEVPESKTFVQALSALAEAAPSLEIFEATKL